MTSFNKPTALGCVSVYHESRNSMADVSFIIASCPDPNIYVGMDGTVYSPNGTILETPRKK